jgi:hypothetical protein
MSRRTKVKDKHDNRRDSFSAFATRPAWVRAALYDLNRVFGHTYFDTDDPDQQLLKGLPYARKLLLELLTGSSGRELVDGLQEAEPPTVRFLKLLLPEIARKLPKIDVHFHCEGPLSEDCFDCPKLAVCRDQMRYFLRMPHFVLDLVMPKVNGNAWLVFCYLSRRATFNPTNRNYGQCWVSYSEITQATGVKCPARSIRELKKLKLILHAQNQRRADDGSCKTTNHFVIHWFSLVADLELLDTTLSIELEQSAEEDW